MRVVERGDQYRTNIFALEQAPSSNLELIGCGPQLRNPKVIL
jgi:hypothetical protein